MVEVIEIGHNYRDWQSDGQHTSNRTQAADNLPPDSDGPATRESRKPDGNTRKRPFGKGEKITC